MSFGGAFTLWIARFFAEVAVMLGIIAVFAVIVFMIPVVQWVLIRLRRGRNDR